MINMTPVPNLSLRLHLDLHVVVSLPPLHIKPPHCLPGSHPFFVPSQFYKCLNPAASFFSFFMPCIDYERKRERERGRVEGLWKELSLVQSEAVLRSWNSAADSLARELTYTWKVCFWSNDAGAVITWSSHVLDWRELPPPAPQP